MFSELLVEGADREDPEEDGAGDHGEEILSDGENGARAGDLDEDELDPGGA